MEEYKHLEFSSLSIRMEMYGAMNAEAASCHDNAFVISTSIQAPVSIEERLSSHSPSASGAVSHVIVLDVHEVSLVVAKVPPD
jgi:hypothetical protein